MADDCLEHSRLPLKRELISLKRSRFLRDPETSCSWRYPLKSWSTADSSWNHIELTGRRLFGANSLIRLFESEPTSSQKKGENVFLYNWRLHSGISSGCGTQWGKETPFGGSLQSNGFTLGNTEGNNSKRDAYHEDSAVHFNSEEADPRMPSTKIVQKVESHISRGKHVYSAMASEQRGISSSSLEVLNSVEQSDDIECCNSEVDLPLCKFVNKSCYPGLGSPLLSGIESRSCSIKFLSQGEDSTCTPLSTNAYNRYMDQICSCDGITSSCDDDDEITHLGSTRSHGRGLPCCWSKKVTHRSCRGCCSPLSDTIRRKGSKVLYGSRALLYHKRSSNKDKEKRYPMSAHSLPLLSSDYNGFSSSLGSTSEEPSTIFDEFGLEASSQLDGNRWSSCRSQDEMELAPINVILDQRTLGQKYRPKCFEDLVGQNLVVQSLHNSILKARIYSFYLFQGPRGTGKTSAARIFSTALNCLSIEGNKPCGSCGECVDSVAGKSMKVREVDASNKREVDRLRRIMMALSMSPPFSGYRIFIINECHMLPLKTWSAFLKFYNKPLSQVVLIFVTSEAKKLPHMILSRCQKYVFSRIRDADMLTRLAKLATYENLDIEPGALNLIVLNSEGSLRDAEMMLDQLSLLARRITVSLVNDFVGTVPEEKLLDLLELAMSSDTVQTVKIARELLDSGIDPMALMSQLAGLIMDIIGGTQRPFPSKDRSLNEAELERLKQALKILLEAEKQLRQSNGCSTWFTAALLQLGSLNSSDNIYLSSSTRPNTKNTLDDLTDLETKYSSEKDSNVLHRLMRSRSASVFRTADGHTGSISSSMHVVEDPQFSTACINQDTLNDIWRRCIWHCHSKTLKQLCSHGKLTSILEVEGALIADVEFLDDCIKCRANRFLSSITNSMEIVLGHTVEVRIGVLPCKEDSGNIISARDLGLPTAGQQMGAMASLSQMKEKADCHKMPVSDGNSRMKSLKHMKSFSSPCDKCLSFSKDLLEKFDSTSLHEAKNVNYNSNSPHTILVQDPRDSSDDQRLENAWAQATEKGTPGFKLERNQVLPQESTPHLEESDLTVTLGISCRHQNDDVSAHLQHLRLNDVQQHQKNQCSKMVDHCPICPSLLRSGGFKSNSDELDSGSASGCSRLLCWRTAKSQSLKVRGGSSVPS